MTINRAISLAILALLCTAWTGDAFARGGGRGGRSGGHGYSSSAYKKATKPRTSAARRNDRYERNDGQPLQQGGQSQGAAQSANPPANPGATGNGCLVGSPTDGACIVGTR